MLVCGSSSDTSRIRRLAAPDDGRTAKILIYRRDCSRTKLEPVTTSRRQPVPSGVALFKTAQMQNHPLWWGGGNLDIAFPVVAITLVFGRSSGHEGSSDCRTKGDHNELPDVALLAMHRSCLGLILLH